MAKAKKQKGKVSRRKKIAPSSAEVWPSPRMYLERPDRLRYVRKMLSDEGCVFCKAAQGGSGFESLVLYSGPDAMVMLNKFPYNTGHLLVVPKRHVADLTETNPAEHTSLGLLLKASVKLVRSAYKCDGFNIGMNLGATAGAGIPGHLHWHIVPRWSGDTNFFPLIAQTKCLPETLQQSFDKLYPLFKELS